jgi:hypothetical protein
VIDLGPCPTHSTSPSPAVSSAATWSGSGTPVPPSTASRRPRAPGHCSPRSRPPCRRPGPARPRQVEPPARSGRPGRPRRRLRGGALCGDRRARRGGRALDGRVRRDGPRSPSPRPGQRPGLSTAVSFPPADAQATLAGLQPIKDRVQTPYTRRATETGSAAPRVRSRLDPRGRGVRRLDLPDDPGRPSADPEASRPTRPTCSRAPPSPRRSSTPRTRIFLHASRGFADDPPGLYPQPTVDSYAARWPDLDVRAVPDVNHYTIVLSRRCGSRHKVRAVES